MRERTQREELQTLGMFLAGGLVTPAFIAGFLWQFIDYGWTQGNVFFNRLYSRSR